MKLYLIDLFKYNNWANLKVLECICQVPDKTECEMLFSHLINSQNKWLNRINHEFEDKSLSWFEPAYKFNELEERWKHSLDAWFKFIESKEDEGKCSR